MPIYTALRRDLKNAMHTIGEKISINGQPTMGLISSYKGRSDFEGKNLVTLEEIKRGDIITYNGVDYLVVSEILNHRLKTYYKGVIRPLYLIYNTLDDEGILHRFRCVGEESTHLTDAYKPTRLDWIKYRFIFPNTKRVREHIKLNQRFLMNGIPFKIRFINTVETGLFIVIAESDTYSAEDDIENDISKRYYDGEDRVKGVMEEDGTITPIGEGEAPKPMEPPTTDPEEPEEPEEEDYYLIPEDDKYNYLEQYDIYRISTWDNTIIKTNAPKDKWDKWSIEWDGKKKPLRFSRADEGIVVKPDGFNSVGARFIIYLHLTDGEIISIKLETANL